MKRKLTSRDYYLGLPEEVIKSRKKDAEILIRCAKNKIKELNRVHYLKRDDYLISKIIEAIKWNERIIHEEV